MALFSAAGIEHERRRAGRSGPARRRRIGTGALDRAGKLLSGEGENRRLVEYVTHLGFHAGLGNGMKPLVMESQVLILVLDLAAAVLDRGVGLTRRAVAAN